MPVSVAWTSDRLYRVVSDEGPAGKTVEVDGWDDALDTAWRLLSERGPEVQQWVDNYLGSRGDESLIVTFGDSTRIVGRRGNGYFGVSYPTDLLLAGTDQTSAMRSAILDVLDRHVEKRNLDVPLLSSLVADRAPGLE